MHDNYHGPWVPITATLLYDPRARGGAAFFGVLCRIYLLAAMAPDRCTVALPRRAGEAHASAWKRAFGEEAANLMGDVIASGLVVECDEGLRVTVPVRIPHPQGFYTAPQDTRCAAVDYEPSDLDEPPQGASAQDVEAMQGAASPRLRKLRYQFNHRRGEFRGLDPNVSWGAWSQSPEGRERVQRVMNTAKVEREGGTGNGNAGTERSQNGNGGGNGAFPSVPKTGTENGNGVPPLPLSETSEKKERDREDRKTEGSGARPRERGTGTRERGTGTRERNGNAGTGTEGGTGTERGNGNGVPERSNEASPLDALRDAARGNSTLMGGLSLELEALTVLRRYAMTPQEIARAGVLLGRPSTWWPTSGATKREAPSHVTLTDLAGYRDRETRAHEWKPLDALIAKARGEIADEAAKRERQYKPAVSAPAEAPPAVHMRALQKQMFGRHLTREEALRLATHGFITRNFHCDDDVRAEALALYERRTGIAPAVAVTMTEAPSPLPPVLAGHAVTAQSAAE